MRYAAVHATFKTVSEQLILKFKQASMAVAGGVVRKRGWYTDMSLTAIMLNTISCVTEANVL
jgi:hypothetical protein